MDEQWEGGTQNAHDRAEERSGTKLRKLVLKKERLCKRHYLNGTELLLKHQYAAPAFYALLISLVLSLFLLRREMSAITMMKVNTNGGHQRPRTASIRPRPSM